MSLAALHDELIGRLQGFLNGDSLTAGSRVFYPFLKQNINNWNRLLYSNLAKDMHGLLMLLEAKYPKISFPSSKEILRAVANKKTISSHRYASILSTLYMEIEKNLAVLNPNPKYQKVYLLHDYQAWKKKSNNDRFLQPLHDLGSYLSSFQGHFSHLVLHGSLSTLDYTNFSDIDFMIVLKKESLTPKTLVFLRNKVLYARHYLDLLNPFNHHGFLILNDIDLSFYRQSYLPIETLEHATSFLGGQKAISINVIPDDKENERLRREKLIRKIKYVQNLSPKNAYELLDKISSFLLIPTLLLARQGVKLYKRESFPQIKKRLSKQEQSLLDLVSQARRDWPKSAHFPYGLRKTFYACLNPLLFKFITQNTRFVHKNLIKRHRDVLDAIDLLTERLHKILEGDK